MTVIAFLDTETTGLDPDRHEVWEVGLVLRDTNVEHPADRDVEFVWQLPVDLANAEPIALTIGKFYERRWPEALHNPAITIDGRFENLVGEGVDLRAVVGHMDWWASRFSALTHGAVFVAANPRFDDAFLTRLLRAHGACPGWHYRLVCVESMAVGYLRGLNHYQNVGELPPVPWKGVSDLAERCGITREEHEKHSALADARLVRDLYDVIEA